MSSSPCPKVINQIKEMQELADRLRCEIKTIAFVPTMGYLHKGHAGLIEHACSLADITIASVFVNPLQFGPNEDYSRYPRDFEHDLAVAGAAGADIVFHPDSTDMFPDGFCSAVEVEGVSSILEGTFRPSHFRGVTTVVTKLLNIVKPHIAVFGQKDVQQAFIIKKFVKDLNFDTEIVIEPIIREPDGLALSSRNVYLSKAERAKAPALFNSLQYASGLIQNGQRSVSALRDEIHSRIIAASPSQIDYIAFIDPSNFNEIENLEPPEVLVALAVRFGTTRLIDNLIIPVMK